MPKELWSKYNLSSKLRHIAYIVSKKQKKLLLNYNWKLQWQSSTWLKIIIKPSSVILRYCASFFPRPHLPPKIIIAWLYGISFLTNYFLKGTWGQSNNFCLKLYFLDPWLWPEGSYEWGSVCLSVFVSFHLSVCLSGSFLGIDSLVFSETQHSVRGLWVVHDRAGFFLKEIFVPKMGHK